MSVDLSFVANRPDGLGERLRAIVNAVAFSNKYNARFYFGWPKGLIGNRNHAIGNVEDVFSEDFVSKYYKEGDFFRASKPIETFSKADEPGRYCCDQSLGGKSLKSLPSDPVCLSSIFKEAFYLIDFSDHVKEAIDLAVQINVEPECIAVHIRAGDLVYGELKQNLTYLNKVVPYPLVLEIINIARQRGLNVIIFGQDHELIDYFNSSNNVIVASQNMPPHFDYLQAAFFDLLLMSKCKEIYSGNSGFSILSTIVGSVKLKNVVELLSNKDQLEVIHRTVIEQSSVPKLQRSFACKAALIKGLGNLSDDIFCQLVDVGREADPDSVVFDFLLMWRKYIAVCPESGNSILFDIVVNRSKAFEDFVQSNFSTHYQRTRMKSLFLPSVIEKYTEVSEVGVLYNHLAQQIFPEVTPNHWTIEL